MFEEGSTNFSHFVMNPGRKTERSEFFLGIMAELGVRPSPWGTKTNHVVVMN